MIKEKTVSAGMGTPWGRADHARNIVPGIGEVGTPGHGGVKVCAELNKRIPEAFRADGGWYEEDCEWAVPFFFLAAEILAGGNARDREVIADDVPRKTLIAWHPYEWEKHFDVTLAQGESHTKDQTEWQKAHSDKFQVLAAWGWSEGNNWPEGMVKILARIGGRDNAKGEERFFLVPDEEYKNPSQLVIDPAKYAQLVKVREVESEAA